MVKNLTSLALFCCSMKNIKESNRLITLKASPNCVDSSHLTHYHRMNTLSYSGELYNSEIIRTLLDGIARTNMKQTVSASQVYTEPN